MKRFWLVLTTIILLGAGSITSYATDYQFDPNYYARKYPDVVEALGKDPEALKMHFRMYGYKEGRFANQQEEIDSMLPGYTRQAYAANENPEPATLKTDMQITETTVPSTILPGMSTYVDINIDTQTMTYFENGEAKLQGPCVTGNVNNGNGTPYGTFTIINKVPGKYLVGPTWRCWVDRWMQFTDTHIGLHDAKWRSSFGGDIYQTNGSHGCVNLPHDTAVTLYDMVNVGTTVIVH